MNRPLVARHAVWALPVLLILAAFGRLVAHPAGVLVDAARPTVDQARVVDATPGNDLTRQFWPLHLYVARTLARTGHLPEWDDRGFGGRPLVGNPQAGLFYPPAWLAWLSPAPATLGWITVGHLIGASLGMSRLARTLHQGRPGQLVAAGCFALSPYVLAQTFEGHYPHVWAACWYPVAFGAMIEIGRGRWRWGLTLAVSLAAVGLVGHPQEGYYLAVALAAWAGCDLVGRVIRAETRRSVLPVLATYVGVGALTLGLVAVELIPDAMTQPWALRSARLPLRLASRYHPLAINAVQVLNPFALGGPADYFGPENYWETVLSVGLIPLVLAGVGATWTRYRQVVRPWIILLIAAVAFAAGRKLGVFGVLYEWLPGMDRFRVPSRSLFLANLAAAILAGFGVEALRANWTPDPDRWARLARSWLVLLVFLGLAIGWGFSRGGRAGIRPTNPIGGRLVEEVRSRSRTIGDLDRLVLASRQLAGQPVFGLAVTGLTIGLGAGWIWPRRRGGIAVGLGLLGLIELAGAGWQLLVVSPPVAFLAGGSIEAAIRGDTPRGSSEPPPRIRADESVLPDLIGVDLGLGKTDINDTFQIQHAADLYEWLYELSRPKPADLSRPMDQAVVAHAARIRWAILDRMAVTLAIADDRTPRSLAFLAASRWPILAVVPGRYRPDRRVTVARNPTALPRAYVVPRAEVVARDDARLVNRFATADPREVVLTTVDPLAGVAGAVPRQRFKPAAWLSDDPDRLVLEVTTDGPGLLVVADTWMPGWRAEIDGRATPVERGNHAQRVVALPEAGRHRIFLSYRAPGWRLGAAISGVSVLAWLAIWGVGRRRLAPPGPGTVT